jgi:hypothetical protein
MSAQNPAPAAAGPDPVPRPVIRGRAWAGIAAAVILAAGVSGCAAAEPPPPMGIRCSGPTLRAPDSGNVYYGLTPSPPPASAVPGAPYQAGTMAPAALPDAPDPDDLSYGYKADGGLTISLVNVTAGSAGPVWTVAMRDPPGMRDAGAGLSLDPHDGYVVATGGSQGQFIAAVSSSGIAGPACVLPRFAADRNVELLPHSGVLILANPAEPVVQPGDFWLDGYSTSTGRRLWSIPADTSISDGFVTFTTDSGTLYVWQARDARVSAYNAGTGSHLWTAGVPGTQAGAGDNGLLAAFGGRVYAAFDVGVATLVTAMSATSGAIEWHYAMPPVGSSSQITVTRVGSGEVLLADGQATEELLLSAATGVTLSSAAGSTGAAVDNPELQVCYPGGQLAVAVPDSGSIHVLSADQRQDRTVPIAPGQVDVAVTGTEAYVRQQQPGAPVLGYDLATGRLLWTAPAPGVPGDATLQAFNGGFILEAQGSAGVIYL